MTRTFLLKADAELWARQKEVELDRGVFQQDPRRLEKVSLGELVERYRDEVSARKRSWPVEQHILNRFLREPLCRKRLSEIRPSHFAEYRDRRLKDISPSGLNRELSPLQHMFNIARIEWDLPINGNPISEVARPKNNPARVRRLAPGEEVRLLKAASMARTHYLAPSITLAIETAMRRGEILAIRPIDFSSDFQRLSVPLSKSGHPRIIPLSKRAQRACESLLEVFEGQDRLVPVSPVAFRLNWQRTAKRAGIENLHFHDLRHEAISRLFERGLSMPEVAAISGHRDYRMLARYAHVTVELD